MATEYRGLDFLDFFIVLIKWKRLLISLGIILLIGAYLAVYFLLPPEYDASATILSTEESQGGALSSVIGGLSNLPLDMFGFGGLSSQDKYNLFTTIVYSRSNIDDLIEKFNLDKDYPTNRREDLVNLVRAKINVSITDESAYIITVRALYPEKAAEITNYLVDKINKKVIELNVKKSKENRKFLEGRYQEILTNLRQAEDSLKIFQEKSNMLEAESQTQAIIEAYAKMESELALKQIELAVAEKIAGPNTPQTKNARIAVQEYQKKLDNLKKNNKVKGLLLPLDSLPDNIIGYYRLFRNVEIYNKMLEFIIPMYEQARFEEAKAVPVLQIIDNAIPPEKKSFPPRTIFSVLITFFLLGFVILILLIREIIQNSKNEKLKFIRKELFSFRTKKD